MTQTVLIDPAGIYDDGSLQQTLGLTSATLARARRRGELRFTRKGKRTFYLGKWVRDWLALDAKREEGEE